MDLTAKKKKKTKKFEFNADDDSAGKNVEEGTAASAAAGDDDDVDDLGDFSGLKKKKKKKKPFNLDDLEASLPADDGEGEQRESPSEERADDFAAADAGADDLDFDFSAKKKKKKKKAAFDLPDVDEAGADKENEAGEIDDEFKEDGPANSGSKWFDTDRDYTYDELLEIIYNKIKEKNPESDCATKKKLVMRPPQVLRVGTKKTSFANFLEICKSYVVSLYQLHYI